MNKSVKYGLLVLLGNILTFLLLLVIGDKMSMDSGLFVILVVPGIILLVELVLGIVFAAGTTSKKDLGTGLLIGFGLTLLIGLGVCGLMASF